MRITIDTNILVSSTFWSGDSDKILKMAENEEIELVLSEEITSEFSKVLMYDEIQNKVKNKNLEIRRSVEKIISFSTMVEPKQKLEVVEDPDDNIILECAVEGNVDYIVSNDNHLLKLGEYGGIKIVRPGEFLEVVGGVSFQS